MLAYGCIWLACTRLFPFILLTKKTNYQYGHIVFILLVHYDDVRMGAIASQITSLTIVYSIVYSDADQRKHQSSASLAFVRGIHREPVNSPHKWPVTRKMVPFDDVIMSVDNPSRHVSYTNYLKPRVAKYQNIFQAPSCKMSKHAYWILHLKLSGSI